MTSFATIVGSRRVMASPANLSLSLVKRESKPVKRPSTFRSLRLRVRTYKGDSIIERFVIHGLGQETWNESRLFLADEGSVRAA